MRAVGSGSINKAYAFSALPEPIQRHAVNITFDADLYDTQYIQTKYHPSNTQSSNRLIEADACDDSQRLAPDNSDAAMTERAIDSATHRLPEGSRND